MYPLLYSNLLYSNLVSCWAYPVSCWAYPFILHWVYLGTFLIYPACFGNTVCRFILFTDCIACFLIITCLLQLVSSTACLTACYQLFAFYLFISLFSCLLYPYPDLTAVYLQTRERTKHSPIFETKHSPILSIIRISRRISSVAKFLNLFRNIIFTRNLIFLITISVYIAYSKRKSPV